MDCSVGLPGNGGRFRLRIAVMFFLNPRGFEAISGANSFEIRVANRFTSRVQFRSLTLPEPSGFGSWLMAVATSQLSSATGTKLNEGWQNLHLTRSSEPEASPDQSAWA